MKKSILLLIMFLGAFAIAQDNGDDILTRYTVKPTGVQIADNSMTRWKLLDVGTFAAVEHGPVYFGVKLTLGDLLLHLGNDSNLGAGNGINSLSGRAIEVSFVPLVALIDENDLFVGLYGKIGIINSNLDIDPDQDNDFTTGIGYGGGVVLHTPVGDSEFEISYNRKNGHFMHQGYLDLDLLELKDDGRLHLLFENDYAKVAGQGEMKFFRVSLLTDIKGSTVSLGPLVGRSNLNYAGNSASPISTRVWGANLNINLYK